MGDTQWPRFYVFEKPVGKEAFILAGSVHAPDREMALLIARDNFARRPSRTAMWVVRDRAIHSWTLEQLAGGFPDDPGGAPAAYEVFAKRNHKGVHVHRGRVTAGSPAGALVQAVEAFGDGKDLVWWLVPVEAFERSGEEDQTVLYESTPGKDFRHEREYPVRTMMMALRNRKKD